MTDGKKDQLKRKKTLEYELRRLYRAGELTEQQIAELKEAEFPFDTPVRRTAKSVVRIDDGKKWPSCSAAEKELGITQGWMSDVCNMAQNGKWVAIKNQFYCFESMYSPDMDLTEIRGLAGWIVILGTAVLTDIDPGCRAELNGFKPYLDTRIEVFNGQNGQKNVLAEAGKALSSGSLSAICDDYGMDYAVLNYGINDVGIQDLNESGFKPIYSDNLTVCLKRSTV